ncbi:MAG: hypothetical protein NOOUEUKL_000877 [Candidatus Fervidibacter sp.]
MSLFLRPAQLPLCRPAHLTTCRSFRLGRSLALPFRKPSTDLDKALSILERYADKDFSLTDAISFAVMGWLGISVALSLDRHFVEYGGGFFVIPLMGTRLPEG